MDGRQVVKIDPALNVVADVVRVGRRPTSIAVGEGAVWIANSGNGTVSRIDPRSNTVRTIKVGHKPVGSPRVRGPSG